MTRRVLLVEDDPFDVDLIRRTIRKIEESSGMTIKVDNVRNGRDALERLFDGSQLRTPKYHLILLDLNMPIMGGHEVLQFVRQHPLGGLLPIVVLTTSNTEMDIERAWTQGAKGYLPKPAQPEAFQKMLDALRAYWFEHLKLPA